MSFDHTAAVPKSLHWKRVECYIHFKELLLVSKVLNAKLESLSNLLFALCSKLQAWDHSHWVYWFAPLCLGTPTPRISLGIHLSGHTLCLRIQRNQSSFFQKSKLEGMDWEPLVIVSKWQSTPGSYTTDGVIRTWISLASEKSLWESQGILNNVLTYSSSLPTACPRIPGGTDPGETPKVKQQGHKIRKTLHFPGLNVCRLWWERIFVVSSQEESQGQGMEMNR